MPSEEPFSYFNTDKGEITVVLQGPRGKGYTCPLCKDEVVYEWHYVLVPKDKSFRRHAHKRCVELAKENNWKISLAPARSYG